MSRRVDILPSSLPPRGLSRVEAAAYLGVSPSLFDAMVRDGRMPLPKRINARAVWDRRSLDIYFEALPDEALKSENPWDEVAPQER
jgi:predicted DNA-binding transcriptional regulator AlpA